MLETDKPDLNLWYQCKSWQPGNFVDHLAVLVINANRLMTHHDMDFTQGGNDLEDRWIRSVYGPRVILLDDRVRPDDFPFIIYHEAHERRLMARGWPYNNAHRSANAAEKTLRLRYNNAHN